MTSEEGDIVVNLTEPLSTDQESEAWKIAQLAAVLMAGRFAKGDSPTVNSEAPRAQRLLEIYRQLVRNPGSS